MSGLAQILADNERLRQSLAERDALLSDRDMAVVHLEQALREQGAALREREAALQTVTAQRDAVQQRVEQLDQALAFLKNKALRPASQRVLGHDGQEILPMFTDIVAPPRAPVPQPQEPEASDSDAGPKSKPERSRKGTSRRSREAFADLPSREIRCPAASDAACRSCGGDLRVIGQAASFRINWVPGHFVVEDIVRDKCACPSCPSEGVLTVPGPYALDGALCADGLLVRVLIDKFADHLPLHRQADRMAREGFVVGTHTLSSWVVRAAGVLRRVALAVREQILQNSFVQGDDTGFPVQDGGDGQLRKGRMWAFTDQAQVFYAFTDTKQGKFPTALLQGFTGDCLLADGGSEFNEVVSALELERAGCWSHLRTYFFYALSAHPVEADLALGTLRDIFMLERTFAHLSAEERLAERQRHILPLVDGLMAWVRELAKTARPKSKLMEALTYATNQEHLLRVCVRRGDIPIHNNLSELMLRRHVVGRKNWLFAGSEGGAKAAADLFTLIGSCRLQGIDPHTYLVDVLGRVMDHPAKRVGDLTPRAWRQAKRHTEDAA